MAPRSPAAIRAFLFDLDGTVYRGRDAVPGAAAFIARMRREGRAVLFVTNRANRTRETVSGHLCGLGIGCGPDDVVTSAQAAAGMLAGRSAWFIGETGVAEALAAAEVRIDLHAPDAVLVSYDRHVTLAKIGRAAQLIRAGARFVATNTDSTITTEAGRVPEAGPIVAAVADASGARPEVAGKPSREIVDHALNALGVLPEEAVMVGDNPDTDIRAAVNAGTASALILTGVVDRAEAARGDVRADWVVDDYAALERLFS